MSGKAGKWIRRIALGAAGLIGLAVMVVAVLAWRVQIPGSEIVPAGLRRNTAVYVPMRDGAEIAVDVWLPPDLKKGERVPVLMRSTRYWRALGTGWAYRPAVALQLLPRQALLDGQSMFFNREGFAIVIADVRGTGASSGDRLTEYSPKEIADLGEVADWTARQAWSNGRVGTFGVSYDGNTAELAAVPNSPAVRAVAPLYDDFDTLLGLAHPGGIYDSGMIEQWSTFTTGMDHDTGICVSYDLTGFRCWFGRQLIAGVKTVDADPNGKHLEQILTQRNHPVLVRSMGAPEFRDDDVPTPEGAINLAQITPFGLKAQIESSGVPMMVWCGWLDAGTCEGTLSRFNDFKNPQQVIIGAFSHGGGFDVDPFIPLDKHSPPNPPSEEQFQMQADFFHHNLSGENPAPVASSVHYYTMGEGQWHTTAVWPPPGLAPQRFYFDGGAAGSRPAGGANPQGSLNSQPPAAASASDSYTVDFTTTTGPDNRWHTQLGGYDVIYPDRAQEDKKLITYTGAPLETDLEITGSPILALEMASTLPDGAVFAYLEDVSPEGRVTYVTEGIFRVVNRKIATGALPYIPLGPAHSFRRSDVQPLVPGEAEEIAFSLFPTSVVLRKGHSIRLALAGADASMFTRCPAEGTPTWTVFRQQGLVSYLELPMKAR